MNVRRLYVPLLLIPLWGCDHNEYDILTPQQSPSFTGSIDSLPLQNPLHTTTKYTPDFRRDTITVLEGEYVYPKLYYDDTEYPYAGIPRIIIQTKDLKTPEDTKTEIPARAIIVGRKGPESDTLSLTIRCRGNSTFEMDKKSYKLEFDEKQKMLGMPKNKDWALLANYSDKTLLKNHVAFTLSKALGMEYTPRSEMVELYLNREYLGVYQLTENIKAGKDRVNIKDEPSTMLVESDARVEEGKNYVTIENEMTFRVIYPKTPTTGAMNELQEFLQGVDDYLETVRWNLSLADSIPPDDWFDMEDFARHYWIQEFAMNRDAIFYTSVFFTWAPDDVIHMGPIWDFDIAFGGEINTLSPQNWYIRNHSWNRRMMKIPSVRTKIANYWKEHREVFESILDSVDASARGLAAAAENNFKRWPILESTAFWSHVKSYDNYQGAIDDFKKWMKDRVDWIDENL